MKMTMSGNESLCAASMFKNLHTSQNFRKTLVFLICIISRTLFWFVNNCCELLKFFKDAVDTSNTAAGSLHAPASLQTCILMTCTYIMITVIKPFSRVFINNKWVASLSKYWILATVSLVMLIILTLENNIHQKILCGLTIVYIQITMIYRSGRLA